VSSPNLIYHTPRYCAPAHLLPMLCCLFLLYKCGLGLYFFSGLVCDLLSRPKSRGGLSPWDRRRIARGASRALLCFINWYLKIVTVPGFPRVNRPQITCSGLTLTLHLHGPATDPQRCGAARHPKSGISLPLLKVSSFVCSHCVVILPLTPVAGLNLLPEKVFRFSKLSSEFEFWGSFSSNVKINTVFSWKGQNSFQRIFPPYSQHFTTPLVALHDRRESVVALHDTLHESTPQDHRKEHSKTEIEKREFQKKFEESETFSGSKFSRATGVTILSLVSMTNPYFRFDTGSTYVYFQFDTGSKHRYFQFDTGSTHRYFQFNTGSTHRSIV